MLVKAKNELPKCVDSILLIQLGDIGDVVLTMPTLKALKEHYPESNLIMGVREKAKDLLEDCPWTNGIISIKEQKKGFISAFSYQKNFLSNLRKYHFDMVIDLRTGTRGAILAYLSGAPHRLGRYADDGRLWRNRLFTHLVRPEPENELKQYAADHGLNIISPLQMKVKDRLPLLTVSQGKKDRALSILKKRRIPLDKPVLAVHPFSLWKYKEWKSNKWKALIDALHLEYGFTIIMTGSQDERDRAARIKNDCKAEVYNLAGKTPLGVLPCIFQSCLLFMGVDTAALHMAAAVGTPTVGLFGPSSPVTWAPRGDRHLVITKNYECVPCRRKGCEDSQVSRCLNELTVEEVRDKVVEHIEKLHLK